LTHDFWRGQKEIGEQQSGGAIIEGDGIRYDYRTNTNGERIIFRGGRKAGQKECFMLFLDPDRTATLQSLKQGANCALDPNGTGRTMVLAAVNLAKEKGATTLELADDSKKWINDTTFFKLSNMYFLTSGKTWYATIIPTLQPTDTIQLMKIQRWSQSVTTNTWASVANKLPSYVTIPVDISDIDIHQQGSAMVVFNRIKDAGTHFFVYYDDEALAASGIGNLYGISWKTNL
jgi:hypothetical protein